MSKRQGLLFIGVFTIVLALSGLPSDWKTVFTVLIGLGLIIISYYTKKENPKEAGTKKESSVFVENDVKASTPQE